MRRMLNGIAGESRLCRAGKVRRVTETKRSVPSPTAVPDADVSRYETLPIDVIRKELDDAGINPDPTISAVRKLIEESLAGPGRAGGGSKTHQRVVVPAAHHDANHDHQS